MDCSVRVLRVRHWERGVEIDGERAGTKAFDGKSYGIDWIGKREKG